MIRITWHHVWDSRGVLSEPGARRSVEGQEFFMTRFSFKWFAANCSKDQARYKRHTRSRSEARVSRSSQSL
jgi:hypothetical protein